MFGSSTKSFAFRVSSHCVYFQHVNWHRPGVSTQKSLLNPGPQTEYPKQLNSKQENAETSHKLFASPWFTLRALSLEAWYHSIYIRTLWAVGSAVYQTSITYWCLV